MPVRTVLRTLLAAVFLVAGVLHLTMPEPFLRITPDWVVLPRQVIVWTGLAEIAGAAGLMVPRLRQAAGIGLALYAVCVFPANIQHAMDWYAASGGGWGWLYHGPRLLAQPVIVWVCLWASGTTSWPFRRQAA